MGRLIAIVSVLLMSSAISLVTARFQSRRLFIQSDRLSDKAHELDTDWRRLQLERAELVRNARIDGIARSDLKMVNVTPGSIIYIAEGLKPGDPDVAVPPAVQAPKPQAAGRRPARPGAARSGATRSSAAQASSGAAARKPRAGGHQ
ncbi:cell division protein FtsL [Candidimonas nitroreducens]|uniref:Cell division protein FtsL n=1 Tax=Candidimonas nitroreducens TaxID=683354 RepID=A0A225MGT5_9BURK|nr:cell division protein FtsL [Candidimonas nitroreducens]